MRNYYTTALVAVTCLLGAAARGGDVSSAGLFDGVVVAKGQGVEVRRGQLDDAFVALQANLAARGQNIPEERRLQTEAQVLDGLLVIQLLVKKATVADKAKARENAAKLLEEFYRSSGSEESFLRRLKVLGTTPQQLTNQLTEQAIGQELVEREDKSKIIITQEQLQQFYTTNDAAFRQPEMARASHILILTRDPRTRMELPEDQ
ncbi:MAG: hypothetical protein NTW03_17255, partial [Verrucomicrobia bacterium]|nr:hypothetical protein [Verrucomicrobiota bacterium]